MKLLDCTLRDGGYYNDWDFDSGLVEDYIAAMDAAHPDAVEIGFRFRSADRYLGPYAFTPEGILRELALPSDMTLAVMVNEADFPEAENDLREAVEASFLPCAESRLDMVRVAVNRERLSNAANLIANLERLGYRVALNVMQMASVGDDELDEIARQASAAAPDILYFADSTGSLQPEDIRRLVAGLRLHWNGPLGIHAHDNMQMALANCKTAIAEGVEWIDGTVLGMGRGPGNARTEHLLMELASQRALKGDIAPLLKCIRDWFEPLRDQFRWGANPYYYLSGMHGIHPTYIQTMLADSRYAVEDILATIEHLRTRKANRYSRANLEQAGNFYGPQAGGTWRPADQIAGREVLILGSGPGCRQHRHAIEAFIEAKKPIVIALNVNSPIRDELIDLHVACHPIRLLRDSARYGDLCGSLVAPVSALPDPVQQGLAEVQSWDFGLALSENGFEFNDTHAVLPRPMAAAYALAIANSGRASQIYMAGFDGYGPEDPRNVEMSEVLEDYYVNSASVELRALTPTCYEIVEDSIYRLTNGTARTAKQEHNE